MKVLALPELALTDSTWVIAITRRALTESGRSVEVNMMVLDATAYLLEYQFDADS